MGLVMHSLGEFNYGSVTGHYTSTFQCETLTIILLIVLLTEVVMAAKFGEDVHT